MKKFIPLMVLLATMPVLTLTSCDLLQEIAMVLLDVGDDAFYAKDFTKNKDYKVATTLMYDKGYCKIYQENNAKGSLKQTEIDKIGDEYNSKIHQLLVDKFSKKNFSYTDGNETENFSDMLHFANWAVGQTDNRLTILLLDIKDGWGPGKGYVAGYFWGGNFLNTTGSNGRDMIYIDTHPALNLEIRQDPKPSMDTLLENVYSTLAHEGQHLVNFITSIYLLIDDGKEEDRVLMDTWIDEGLASQAEYFFQEIANINAQENNNNVDRCIGFNEDSEGTIAKGNNFFVWGNYPDNSILDEYATVYLFNRWLYLQANDGKSNSDFFMKIISSKYGNERAVTEAAYAINSTWSDWPTLLGTWMAANYYPANTTYGYKGDSWLMSGTLKNGSKDEKFKGVQARAISGSTAQLAPGEGVYSKKNGAFNPSNSGNIRYVGINSGSTMVSPKANGSITEDIIITFNANTDAEGAAENGSLTGGTADPKPTASVQGRSVGRSLDPYRIDARDLMGRNREKILLKTGLLKEFKANIGTVQVQPDQEQ